VVNSETARRGASVMKKTPGLLKHLLEFDLLVVPIVSFSE
jgi:hypothetical protein